MQFFDAHNHLHDPWLEPHLDDLAAQLPALGLRRAVANGTCEDDWPAVSDLSLRLPWVVPSFGLHPWHAGNRSPHWLDRLRAALAAHPAAHVGEVGLDRWMLDRARPDDPRLAGLRRSPPDEQREILAAQLALAAGHGRAATIHCLDAWGALVDLLEGTPVPARGFLLHAYAGPVEMVPRFVRLGAYFSFNTAFIHDPRKRHAATFAAVPAERLLAETDAPAMPPPSSSRPHQLPPAPSGETINHPANIVAAYTVLATIRGLPVERLADQLALNFQKLFGPA
ncbi:TatD family hydrolase [Termitidicoccus mucosus]|uniref:Hydrolase TatD n=1 Tax=Termitidicoccus mucosus TaxID=1184151 RepID=A0A178IMI4_9BACT|nr:hydrolase TatD [Opitutaceae bacterium TSB47]